MIHDDKPSLEELMHYGMPRRSGRYPWGSGKEPYQHSTDFLSRVEDLKRQNVTFYDETTGKTYSGTTAIAKTMGMSTSTFRTQYSLARGERRALEVARAKSLRADGKSLNEIARIMGYKNDSSIRSLLNEKAEVRMNKAKGIANDLKKIVDEKGMIDVGAGVERELNISSEMLDKALDILEMQGYYTFGGRIPQVTNPKQMTTLKVLCPPGTPYKEHPDGKKTSRAIYEFDKIHSVKDYISRDGGETLVKKFQYPESMDSNRLMIRYKEDGGIDKDGIVELRRNVADLSLGESHYAQVRILVDKSHYIKGMAVYGKDEDFPPGVDVIFNTNKTKDKTKLEVLKPIKNDPDNPFGSAIKDIEKGGQYEYIGKDGKKHLGLINKRSDEGDWSDWSDNLPSQFLSKQSESLAKRQLGLAIKDKTDEFNDIMALNNPTIKKKLLQDFADGCDSSAVHLKAAALPRQKYHVIIPITALKDTEIYAPKYNDGEKVALIRYPHGGTFEIPILTVNNKHRVAKSLLGPDIEDAVGINSKVAEQLSGADFDGDTVMVIPTNDKVKITSKKPLKDLEGFDPKIAYATEKRADGNYYNAAGQKVRLMTKANTQKEMGVVSNLICDMTLKGATDEELASAVKHSMVVIDAEKHKLDYKQSELDNNIKFLKQKYQDGGGASTLISKAKGDKQVPKRQGSAKINTKLKSNGQPNPDYDPSRPEGALIWKTADDLYYDKYKTNKRTGVTTVTTKMKTQPVAWMEDTDDAYTLVSKANTPMERLYADYANKMKSMANQARKEMVYAGKIEYDSQAKKVYKSEVDSLMEKLYASEKNKPRERQAQAIANSRIAAKKKDNPGMSKEDIKKLNQQELTRARELVGAKRVQIEITDREWEAIQAGAISESNLKDILDYADMDILRERATPKTTKTLSAAKINRIDSMKESGLTIQQIANALGVSTSTVSKYLKEKKGVN